MTLQHHNNHQSISVLQSKHSLYPNTMVSNQKNTATGQNETEDPVQLVTSTLGNTVGGVVGTLGNVTGAALRGVGNTLTGTTGEIRQPVGNAVGGIVTGVESLLNNVAKGVEKAGEQK
ncbi:uncharacterized protein FOBCDRAFT_277094 [Fusarium oxysporum Fo47]|nr:uncharacterized protein FOBCDRAFT_277094 [Fusarium oxysporum Fo47]QKD57459.2 hypothetical protein FOBCDRAFT_277094 [Fusarium oxysporum Fo47]